MAAEASVITLNISDMTHISHNTTHVPYYETKATP